jgi:hypothetical protein
MTKQRQKRKRHGACTFSPELGEKICAALAVGRSILCIARNEEMPPESTIRRWGRNSKWSSEEFVAEYARAREDNADHHFDRMQEIEARLEKEDIDPHSARVLLDSMKWRLSKQLPRSYGDRTAVEVSGRVERPISDSAPEWMQEAIKNAAAHTPSEQQGIDPVENPQTEH